MYPLFLFLHSWLRWIVLILGLWAVVRAYLGVSSARRWSPSDENAGRWFVLATDVQLLVGLALYAVLSPITTHAMSDMGAAMRDPVARFWAVEHVFLVIVAVVLAHVGRARARRARTDASRHRTSAIFYTLAVVAILAAIPWPFVAYGRPLFRLTM